MPKKRLMKDDGSPLGDKGPIVRARTQEAFIAEAAAKTAAKKKEDEGPYVWERAHDYLSSVFADGGARPAKVK